MQINFKNKKILIIGGSGRIGRQITNDFALNGGKVLVLDTIKKFKDKKNIFFKKLKINKISKLEIEIKKILSHFGCPDILINCSYPKSANWKNINFDKITSKEISQNVQGSIINLSSIYGLQAQNLSTYENTLMRENAIYTPIKGSLSGLTWSMASYYGKYNIRVNSLCPGGVFNSKSELNKINKAFFKNYMRRVAIKRMCTSKDISNVAIFLSSEFANYITGVNLPIDGGFTIS